MKARERLKELYRLDLKIERERKQIEDLKQRMYTVSAPALDADRVKTSGSGDDKLLKLIASVERTTRRIERDMGKHIKLYNQITSEIERVQDERAKTILTSRYVLYMQWDAIANDLGYEMSYVYRLHQDAVRMYAALNGYEY